MSTINDGGPAFPVWELNGHGQPEMTGFGMTLRDYFAAKAMQGLLMSEYFVSHKWTEERVAELSYGMADAMLAVREQSDVR